MEAQSVPIFPVPSDEGMGGIQPQEEAPLLGPDGSTVGSGSGENLRNLDGLYQDQDAKAPLEPGHSRRPLSDADFHPGGVSRGTAQHLDTNGVV